MNASNITPENKGSGWKVYIRRLMILVIALILILGGIKGWRIYQKGKSVYQDITALRVLAQYPPDELDIDSVMSKLVILQDNLGALTQETKPLIWIAPNLKWVPTYGDDIAHGPAFLDLANHLVNASILSLQAAGPLLDEVNSSDSSLNPTKLTKLLLDAQPELLAAREEFDQVLSSRDNIQVEQLSPRLQAIMGELNPLIDQMNDGLLLSTTLPVILGADGKGSKTYLLLVQNEDELRPTGGFITTVGRLVVNNGEIIRIEFEGVDNDEQEDWTKPYPAAPWQLQEYMNARVLILRDSNWYADFPTNARWAKYLYSYTHSYSVDGVIAFDQQFLVMLLSVLGPLEVDGEPHLLTNNNVIAYMRSAKSPPDGEPLPVGWDRKQFMSGIADALLVKLIDGKDNEWRSLAALLKRALEERHLLLQFDDPEISAMLAKYDWDNAVRPADGDFLMTTDTNIGFNKTSALMNVSLSYNINLIDILRPESSLTVSHYNNASSDVPCIHWGYKQLEGVEWYPMDRCYWNYLRVYKQSGAELVDAAPHSIPREWMLLGKNVPARVDILDEEIEGVQGYGTLLVIPGSESIGTVFDFSLPASVLAREKGGNQLTYRLKVQKQPGTIANSLEIRVHLPNHSQVEFTNMEALIQGDDVLIKTNLRTDVYLELVFSVP